MAQKQTFTDFPVDSGAYAQGRWAVYNEETGKIVGNVVLYNAYAKTDKPYTSQVEHKFDERFATWQEAFDRVVELVTS